MRPFTVVDAPQRSEEWREARAGRATSSRACDVVDFLKSGSESARRRDYRLQLVCERLTGRPQDSEYVNDDMRRGNELEPDAIAAYEAREGVLVEQTGFIAHNGIEAGASLDGHLGDFDSLIEVKAPRPATHLKYLQSDSAPADYVPQMLHAIWLTGAVWCDFISFCPQMPDGLRLHVVRFLPTNDQIRQYERQLIAFLNECDAQLQAVRTMADLKGQMAAAVGA
jgi:hypothetical protein